jgi:ABC-type branched-subunit amino acid transport system permease subunit
MRAAVDNPGLAGVRGVSTARMARLAWVVSYIFAAVSGVLLSPIFGSDPLLLTLVVLYALVAMVIGGMVSLPFTLAGGIIVGLTDALALGYLPAGDVTARVRGVLPFALLFTALVLRSRSFVSAGGGNEARSALGSDGGGFTTGSEVTRRSLAIVAGAGGLVMFFASDFWIYLLATGIGYGLIFLSYKFFTSTTGLVSLAQGAFGGIGAFTAAILAGEHGLPWLVALLGGAAAAALAGLIVALPTVRLRGIFLALATVAFAQLVETTAFNVEAFSGLEFGKAFARPWAFESDARYFALLLATFVLLGWFADRFRRSVLGRELQADLASGMGSRSVGIRPDRGRMVAFLVSAGMAGVGGALFTAVSGRTATQQWVLITALIWLTVTAIGGIRSMWGALAGGVMLALTPELIRMVPSFGKVYIAAFGLAGLVFLRRPGGIVGLAQDVARAWAVYGKRPPAERVRLDPAHVPPAPAGRLSALPLLRRGPLAGARNGGSRTAEPPVAPVAVLAPAAAYDDPATVNRRLSQYGTALPRLAAAVAAANDRKDDTSGS